MTRPPLTTAQPWSETYSEIIDVRSPSEYVEDHWPGAINLPVLDDQERAKVGTLYKQVDPFTARKLGASRVAQNISRHIDNHFIHKDKDYHPLIYCWRGGQRSNSLALVLSQIGWTVTLLQGGYKTYRAWVREQLQHLPPQFHYRILAGRTGTGKTLVLRRLQAQGAQVLDLEGLANHRGSLLGLEWNSPQPSQKGFETRIRQQLSQFQESEPIWVESESSKIGELYIPTVLWHQMQAAECVEIQIPMTRRVHYLIETYPHLIEHPEVLKEKLSQLKQRHGQQKIQEWFAWIDGEQWEQFVTDILEQHYDPTYRHALQRSFDRIIQTLGLPDLSESSIERAVQTLRARSDLSTADPENRSKLGSKAGVIEEDADGYRSPCSTR